MLKNKYTFKSRIIAEKIIAFASIVVFMAKKFATSCSGIEPESKKDRRLTALEPAALPG